MYAGAIPPLPQAAGLIFVGFTVGIAAAFFGVGGAFLVTPALNILGFPMVYAIGTDLAHMTGKSVIAALRHRRMGHVDLKAGGLLLVGTLPGVKLGALSIMRLESLGATENVVRLVYIVLLVSLGSLILRESLREANGSAWDRKSAVLWRRFRLKPLVSLKTSGIEGISLWSLILLGFLTGFLASFLGVGGGFIRMPALIYLIGMPTKIAIGTDLLEVLFSGGYGTYLYALQGKVDVIAALIMLAGASVGSHLGSLATRHVEPGLIRLYFGLMIIGTAAAVASKQAGQARLSIAVLIVLGTFISGVILYKLAQGLRAESKLPQKESESA